ncbi:MAG: SDR family NAD(P)-dependent oxidoreductase [bacterium]|nr:short-chain dehydrogenase/reductase [Deltaproteobacteria bacterium]MCP4905821.1 SDR family NAD(P)-dependent oxidoreductase [bacterium]
MSEPTPRPTLVTGCSSGIGRAIALRLAREAWPVYASARRIEAIADLAEQGCQLLSLDVTDADSRRAAIEAIETNHGALGGLVNNAGFGQQGPLEEMPLSVIRAQFETNVFAALALCQRALPGMRRQRNGRIVNLSSMGGRLSFPGGAAYHGSKYALEAMTDVLRFEVSGFGIGVVIIEPGPTTTDFGIASVRSLDALPRPADSPYDSFRAGIRRALESTFESPSPGASTPEDVAEAVWTALSAHDPEPRVIVGETARRLIALKDGGTARDWDAVVAGMYPRPGDARRDEEDR